MEDKAQILYNKKNKKEGYSKDIDSYAMWSFCLSIAPIILIGMWFLWPLFAVFPYISLILGIISLNRISKSPEKLKGKGFAIAGIIISVLTIILQLFIMLFMGFVFTLFSFLA